ncbi:MAG: hypothetical protein ACK4HW_11895 [Roseinatronobacter sp.]
MDEAYSPDLLDAPVQNVPGWLRALHKDAQSGLDVLGPDHAAVYLDGNDTLLVTFSLYVPALDGPAPFAEALAAAQGWSRLHLLARRPDWFRAPVIADYLRAQSDGGFFESFAQVIFAGGGMGGFAACAYAPVCPGAQVVAIAPQATLDPAIAGWDTRWPAARRLPFGGRFGFAPSGCDLAEAATVIYDPAQTLDAMHATLFRRPSVRLLRTPDLGGTTARVLARLGVLDAILLASAEGRLDAVALAQACRARKSDQVWLTGLAGLALAKGQAARALVVAERLGAEGKALRVKAKDILRARLP